MNWAFVSYEELWRSRNTPTSISIIIHKILSLIHSLINYFCFFPKFTEIIFIDHQTGNKSYFTKAGVGKIKADGNYGNKADTYGLWHGFGSMNDDYEYQLLICDDEFYSGFLVSGYRKIIVSESGCYKGCSAWCGDFTSPYFRTAANGSDGNGVAFNTNGHRSLANRLISVGLR